MSKYPEIDAVLSDESDGCVIHDDCLGGMNAMSNGSAHLVVTSPPYNIGQPYDEHGDKVRPDKYEELLRGFITSSKRILCDGGRLCINVGENKRSENGGSMPTYCAIASICSSVGLLYRGTLIWSKTHAANRCAWGSWLSPSNPHIVPTHEYVVIYSKASLGRPDREGHGDCSAVEFKAWTNSIWEIRPETGMSKKHPCPFPVELPRRLIKLYTWPRDVVVDPFCGIGTTGVACHEEGRRFIGIELSEKYCELARERARTTTPPLFT